MKKEGCADQQSTSRRLPPFEAWRQPDVWLDRRTGLLRKDQRHHHHPIDGNGLVIIPDVIDELKDLLWPDYELELDPSHPELKSDNHHVYYTKMDYAPVNNDDSLIPFLFREQPSNLAHIHRQVHNMWHDIYDKPQKPSQQLMLEEIRQRTLAREALITLVRAAQQTTELYATFPMRRQDVARHPERIGNRTDDTEAEEYLRMKFNARYSYYRLALEEFREVAQRDITYPDLIAIDDKPKVVAMKLGVFLTRRATNYLPHFLTRAA